MHPVIQIVFLASLGCAMGAVMGEPSRNFTIHRNINTNSTTSQILPNSTLASTSTSTLTGSSLSITPGNSTTHRNSSANSTTSRLFPNSALTITSTSTLTGSSLGITPTTNYTSPRSSMPASFVNSTRPPDLNNATECWPYRWAITESSADWEYTHWTTTYYTHFYNKTTTYGPIPTTYCDGVPRFKDYAELYSAIVPLIPPVLTTAIWELPGTGEGNPYGNEYWPPCTVSGIQECQNIRSMWEAALQNSRDRWSATNVLTISVAPTPTLMIVNGKSTLLTAEPGHLPALPLHGSTFSAGPDGKWSIHSANSDYADTTITPGQQVTFTWHTRLISRELFHMHHCPPPGNFHESSVKACDEITACTLKGSGVELIYFPPPSASTKRDLCADTSSGFDPYSQSIYSHPHISTVINHTTLWMDKAYIRYEWVGAHKTCTDHNQLRISRDVGKVYTNTYVEVESKDVSTMCGFQYVYEGPKLGEFTAATPYPMNFNDLNGPVPASALRCQPFGPAFSEFILDEHKPWLAVPSQLRALDPEWEDCVPVVVGTPDPPIALSSVSILTEDDPTSTPTPPIPRKSILPSSPISTRSPLDPAKPTPDPSSKPSSKNNPNPPVQSGPKIQPHLETSFTKTISLPTALPPKNPPVQHPGNPTPDPNSNTPGNKKPSQPDTPPITIIGNQPIFTDPTHPGRIIIGQPGTPTATTLSAGGPSVVISGTTLSIAPSGTSLLISGPQTLNPIATIDGQPIFLDPNNPDHIIIGDSSLTALQTVALTNGIAVISGTTISVGPQATHAAGSTTTIISGINMSLLPAGPLVITEADGKTYTLYPGSPQVSVDGHTVFFSPDREIVVDGQVHTVELNQSLDSYVSVVVDGAGRESGVVHVATVGAAEQAESGSSVGRHSSTNIVTSALGSDALASKPATKTSTKSGANRRYSASDFATRAMVCLVILALIS